MGEMFGYLLMPMGHGRLYRMARFVVSLSSGWICCNYEINCLILNLWQHVRTEINRSIHLYHSKHYNCWSGAGFADKNRLLRVRATTVEVPAVDVRGHGPHRPTRGLERAQRRHQDAGRRYYCHHTIHLWRGSYFFMSTIKIYFYPFRSPDFPGWLHLLIMAFIWPLFFSPPHVFSASFP